MPRSSPGFKVPANAKFVIEDEKQFPGFNPAYLFRDGLAAHHAAVVAPVRAQPDGLFLPAELDADATHRRASAARDGGGCAGASLQIGGTVGHLGYVRLVGEASFPRDLPSLRHCGPIVGSIGYTGVDFADGSIDRDVFWPAFACSASSLGINVAGAIDLSDIVACQRLRLAAWHRSARIDRGTARRCTIRRHAGSAALHVGGAALCAGRGGLLYDPPTQRGAAGGTAVVARGRRAVAAA